jgi:predicted dehydrogenase
MGRLNRREFLEKSMLATAASAVPFSGRRAGPNDTLRVAVVGVKGRGRTHVQDLSNLKDTQVAAIVDIDEKMISLAMQTAERSSGSKPAYYKDVRKMLEDKTIDAVSIATTNHTHALYSIWAMQAGKHVYVEKPCSHNIFEGRKIIEAARKYNKICQVGTQSRSNKGMIDSVQFLRSGKIGKIQVARGLCYKFRSSIGKKPDGPVPDGVDYDVWLGPAPVRPFNPNRFHYNWHWFWDYGNGDIGNQGVHEMDRARWGLGKNEHPTRVISVGGRLGYEDDGETPNTSVTCLDYGDVKIIFEVRGLPTNKLRDTAIGVIFEGTEGYLLNRSYASAVAFDKDGKKIAEFTREGKHFQNFTDAIRSGKHTDLTADIVEGHLSATLCHLANISYRLGTLKPLASEKPFDTAEGNEAFERMRTHLKDHEIDPETTKVTVGRALTFDPKTETFPKDPEANKLLTREYRKPYVVPENV